MKRLFLVALLATSSLLNAFDFTTEAVKQYFTVAQDAVVSSSKKAFEVGSKSLHDASAYCADIVQRYPVHAAVVAGGLMVPTAFALGRKSAKPKKVSQKETPVVQTSVQKAAQGLWHNLIVQLWQDYESGNVRYVIVKHNHAALDFSTKLAPYASILENNSELQQLIVSFYQALHYKNYETAEQIMLLIEHSNKC